MELSFITKNASQTKALGKKLSQLLYRGDVVGFFGELGSGKTQMIRGICQGFTCADQVSSPTFTIINEYQGEIPVYHFDFYRVNSAQEIFDLGFEEYFFDSGICLIEWAEHVTTFFPQNHIEIFLQGQFQKGMENMRKIKILLKGSFVEKRDWSLLNDKN